MLLNFLRPIFVAMLVAIGLRYSSQESSDLGPVGILATCLLLASCVILTDVIIPRKSLEALAGLFFGLVVGLMISYGVNLMLEIYGNYFTILKDENVRVAMAVIICYLCVSFVLQTKDDIRFVVPYVEFSKQVKGQRPLILDTSVIIDGRIADICDTRIIDQKMVVPRFVLNELQAVADSSDRLKRNRGRRGLDILNRLQSDSALDIEIEEGGIRPIEDSEPVDQKLLILAKRINGRVMTNDYNLNKVAQVRGVEVLNINDLANAMKPVVLPGERLRVRILRAGQEAGQGVGYLDDGTMVVIEEGRNAINTDVNIVITSALQTSAGRMVFGKIEAESEA